MGEDFKIKASEDVIVDVGAIVKYYVELCEDIKSIQKYLSFLTMFLILSLVASCVLSLFV